MSRVIIEDGTIAGNYENKYQAKNPIARYMMARFIRAFDELLAQSDAKAVHEVGCGEGELSRRMAARGMTVRASDFSAQVVEDARRATRVAGYDVAYAVRSAYELRPGPDDAELIVACEVLEHLERPEEALEVLAKLARPWLLVSVPREPIWRALNMCRGKYVPALGNTPGHIQHWSKASFVRLLERHVEVVALRSPLPWTMALCRRRAP